MDRAAGGEAAPQVWVDGRRRVTGEGDVQTVAAGDEHGHDRAPRAAAVGDGMPERSQPLVAADEQARRVGPGRLDAGRDARGDGPVGLAGLPVAQGGLDRGGRVAAEVAQVVALGR